MTAILTGESYATSAEMAREFGPFRATPRTPPICSGSSATIAARPTTPREEYEGLSVSRRASMPATARRICWRPPAKPGTARSSWAKQYGYRNAQTTLLAPTGTIGLLMDCDTTGVEPDFALVKFKKLAGGGYFKIANQSIAPALRNLGYSDEQVEEILHLRPRHADARWRAAHQSRVAERTRVER